jgi:hypothetical protein
VNPTRGDVIRHAEQRDEIAANGRGVAYEAFTTFTDATKSDILDKLIHENLTNVLSDKAVTMIDIYKFIGGFAWRFFLKKAYEYLDSPRLYGYVEYNAWLQKHN